jgi:hypothetical protein
VLLVLVPIIQLLNKFTFPVKVVTSQKVLVNSMFQKSLPRELRPNPVVLPGLFEKLLKVQAPPELKVKLEPKLMGDPVMTRLLLFAPELVIFPLIVTAPDELRVNA